MDGYKPQIRNLANQMFQQPIMKYRRLGNSGLQVSELSLGSWVTFGQSIDDAPAQALMAEAYESGVNFFDNAEGYAQGRSEIVMGNAIKNLGFARDTYVVSSKVFFGAVQGGSPKPNQRGLSRKHVIEACHAALNRLQVDYLDLYFCHRPDSETPIEETVRAMTDLIRQGKVMYWGTSEWSADQIKEAHAIARQEHLVPHTMEQPQYNMFVRDRFETEYADLYRDYGMGTTIWSPLASGLLTGKYNDGIPDGSRLSLESMAWLKPMLENEKFKKQMALIPQLKQIADEVGISLPRFAIAWCLKNKNVSTVILGASKVAQLTENLKASDDAELITEEVIKKVDEVLALV